jgi:2-polyprenyl-6-methoxyphenol hydroxylase-like FAD-dependent oxidoreductase
VSTGERTGVFVIGGGPAGAALAIRLAQLGHRVTLADRSAARRRFGESLAPAVWAQVGLLGAADAVARAAIRPCRQTLVRWHNGDEDARDLTGPPGLLVDRRRFDAILLAVAREHGVRVLQPASVRRYRREAQGWSLDIESGDGRLTFATDFVALQPGARRRRAAVDM